MRKLVLCLVMFALFVSQAMAYGVSEPTMTIDEYSAHRHVRYINDMALCMDRLLRDLAIDSREAYLIDGNSGLAGGYTDAFFNDVVHYAPQHNDHWKNLDVMQRQLDDIFDLRDKIIQECDLLLNNHEPNQGNPPPVVNQQAYATVWLLSPAEDDLIQNIRDNTFQLDNYWDEDEIVHYYLTDAQTELWQTYSFCDFPAIEEYVGEARRILDFVIADINTIASPRHINCDW